MTHPDQDTHDLHTAATNLTHALVLLNATKTTRGRTRTARVMKATPGPQLPGNHTAILLSIELDQFLHEITTDLRNTIAPGQPLTTHGPALTTWIADNAHTITHTIDWTDDLIDALTSYTHRTHRAIGYTKTHPQKEPRQTATTICQRLHTDYQMNVTPDLLRLWTHRSKGHITTEKRGGKNTYLWSEIETWITRQAPEQV
ncbi:hypothetical protein [Corynebacterium sp. p3-SID1194]|uniref:hypothetical protein n=1 Tax=Corynebacterium sp. p3-SID1194 TaxID=2916105 RepID=UPI0021A2F108|nr:hypothetical protein [Corynebacterium sp. p3-SID1194]MCT1450634.1 hypothetical protein [Corynebacterium sp. p3-SID1194]